MQPPKCSLFLLLCVSDNGQTILYPTYNSLHLSVLHMYKAKPPVTSSRIREAIRGGADIRWL